MTTNCSIWSFIDDTVKKVDLKLLYSTLLYSAVFEWKRMNLQLRFRKHTFAVILWKPLAESDFTRRKQYITYPAKDFLYLKWRDSTEWRSHGLLFPEVGQ